MAADINDELLNKLIQEFNTEEEKIFIKHFQIYFKYGYNSEEFIMNFDDIWEFLEFKQKTHAKRLLINKFKLNHDYISLFNNLNNSESGGHNKETIMLKISTFKSLCMLANTEKAERLRGYYVKFEKISLQYIELKSKEAIEKLQNDLKKKEEQLREKEVEILNNKILDHHKELLELYNNKRVIYTLKVQSFDDGSYVIKIGSTEHLRDRVSKIKSVIKNNIILLDVFPCENHIKFESHIHQNLPLLQKLKHREPINDYKSIKTYMMRDDNTYTRVKNAILKSITPFKTKTEDEKKLELKIINATNKQKLIELYKDDVEKLSEALKLLNYTDETCENIETQDSSDEEIIINEASTSASALANNNENTPKFYSKVNVNSPVVQLYDGNDIKKLIKVFPSLTEATREFPEANYTPIKIAAKNRLLYLGYRWHLMDRNHPDSNNAVEIGVTMDSHTRNIGQVAMLNIENTKVLKVFANQKSASEYIQQCASVISQVIKYKKPFNGHNWRNWRDLDIELQNEYLAENELPKVEHKASGVRVQKICQTSGEITNYASMADAVKENRISVNTIKVSAANNKVYQNNIWKLI